jgi:hypothetical protein
MTVQVSIQREGLGSWPSVKSSPEGIILAQGGGALVLASGLADVEQSSDTLRFNTDKVAYVYVRHQSLQHALWAQVRFRGNGSSSWASAYMRNELAEGNSMTFLDRRFERGHIGAEMVYTAPLIYVNDLATKKLREIIRSHSSLPIFCGFQGQHKYTR